MLILSNIKTLYDGTSGDAASLHRGVDLFIDGAVIAERKPHDPALSVGDAHTRVDCSEFTVTPGLIDCHGHITVMGLRERDMKLANSHESLIYVEKILHRTLVEGGVTTLRDVGGATHRMKRLVDAGVLIGPRLKIAICMLSTTGGHADFRGPDRCHATINKLWDAGPGRPSNIVDGPWECRKRVREIAACGADSDQAVHEPRRRFPLRSSRAPRLHGGGGARRSARKPSARGLRVAAHAHSQAAGSSWRSSERGQRHPAHLVHGSSGWPTWPTRTGAP